MKTICIFNILNARVAIRYATCILYFNYRVHSLVTYWPKYVHEEQIINEKNLFVSNEEIDAQLVQLIYALEQYFLPKYINK